MKKVVVIIILVLFNLSCSSDGDSGLAVTKQNLLGKWYLKGGTVNSGVFEDYNHDCLTSRDFQEFFNNDILIFNGYNTDCELNEVEESSWNLNGRIITVSNTHFDPKIYEYTIIVEKITSDELILRQDGVNEDTGEAEVVRYYATKD